MQVTMRHPSVARALGAALALLAVLAPASTARAQCSYNVLTDKVPIDVSTTPSLGSFQQDLRFWTAVAVVPQSGSDWDIGVWQTTAASPTCVDGLLASSVYGGSMVDFVVGDYNHNAFGTRYVQATRWSGTGGARVVWDRTDYVVPVNGAYTHVYFGSLSLIRVFDVYLEAGQSYSFNLQHSGGADIHLLLFANPAGGESWKPRYEHELDLTATAPYTASTTGYHGIVVVDDNGLAGDAWFSVTACLSPMALASGEAQITNLARNDYTFAQPSPFWTVVGLRGSAYWNMDVYASSAPGPGSCFSGELVGGDASSGSAAVLVGDFNYNTPGTNYLEARFPWDTDPGTGTVQWDGGSDLLYINAPLTTGVMGANDVVRAWDVYLESGRTYRIRFGTEWAGLRLLLFRNPGGEYWAGRSQAVASAGGDVDYTAPSSGYYGVVLVNDDGGSGGYALGFGTCTEPEALTAATPVDTWASEFWGRFEMLGPYWGAIGVRASDPAADWDSYVLGPGPSSFPFCHGPVLGSSAQGQPLTDFVIGDFNHNAYGTYDVLMHLYGGIGPGHGAVEWTGTQGVILVNAPFTWHATSPEDFLQVYDVYLTAGVTYRFGFDPGGAGAHLLLFRNEGGGTYWAGRAGAEFDLAGPPAGAWQIYTAPSTGYYGVVAVNDGGGSGSYVISVSACEPRVPLAAGVVSFSAQSFAYWSIDQEVPYWTAVGLRSYFPWDLAATTGPSTYTPWCADPSNVLAYSHASEFAWTDVVVGDFNWNPFGVYGISAYQRWDPGSTGSIEWDSGADQINVNGSAVTRSTGPDDVLEIWDCSLQGGKYYTFELTSTGSAQVELLIFRNTSGTYWASRDQAQLVLPASATWRTTGTSVEWYGLVVVNKNAGTGTYTLRVTDPGTVDAGEPPPGVTALTGVGPNPARGALRIAFDLHESAPVSFQVLDAGGRQVAAVPSARFEAGRCSVAWDGRSSAGARLPAGVYFVRMTAAGQVTGTKRVTLLE